MESEFTDPIVFLSCKSPHHIHRAAADSIWWVIVPGVLGSFVAMLEPVLLILQPIRLIFWPVHLIPVATGFGLWCRDGTNRSVDTLGEADLKGKKVFGQGGFRPVYHGRLEDSHEVIAVKLLVAELQQGISECSTTTSW
jgi:hypothetical protein